MAFNGTVDAWVLVTPQCASPQGDRIRRKALWQGNVSGTPVPA